MSNVRVSETDNPDELDVRSYVLVHHNRIGTPAADLFSAERQDIIRRANGQLRLAGRLIVPDQAVVGARHLAILLQHSWRRSAERSDRA